MNVTRILNRGAIYWADHSGNVGSEQSGMRPVIIIQNNIGNKFSPTVIVVSITSQIHKAKLPTHFEIPKNKYNGIVSDSVVLGEQVRTMDKRRIGDFIGYLDKDDMKSLDEILEVSLNLNKQENKPKEISKELKEKIKNMIQQLGFIDGYIKATLEMTNDASMITEKYIERHTLICELEDVCKENNLNVFDYYDKDVINNSNTYNVKDCLVG